ncbi:sugar 3,4-ketoisomerase [Polycyclovorans algicola]|uniref:sugar 3,4-ketoisomerase n=1 Tax=Polycyclovorans algicola TaxID=616992 RepID=UPI0004A6C897|nr:FdtA/QdtA family cupin domain-containing protein [Polycyclovorans algicola]
MKSTVTWIELAKHGDARGSLVAIENQRGIPFDIHRVYFIFDTLPGVSRGHHAHHDLTQLMICTAGHCKVTVDDGSTRTSMTLDDPCRGLLLDGLIWREMDDFSPDCVLMVLASAPYDETDYIRDYAEFQQLVKVDAQHS